MNLSAGCSHSRALIPEFGGVLDLIDSLLFNHNLSIRKNLYDTLWAGGNYGEWKGLGEQGHSRNEDAVASDYWAFVQATSGKSLNPGSEPDLLLLGHDRTENESLARLRLDLRDSYAVAKADSGIFANNSVYSNNSEVCILWPTAPNNRSGSLLTSNLHDISGLEVQFVVEWYASAAMANITGYGLSHPKC